MVGDLRLPTAVEVPDVRPITYFSHLSPFFSISARQGEGEDGDHSDGIFGCLFVCRIPREILACALSWLG